MGEVSCEVLPVDTYKAAKTDTWLTIFFHHRLSSILGHSYRSIGECMVKIQDQWVGMYDGKTLAELSSYVMLFLVVTSRIVYWQNQMSSV